MINDVALKIISCFEHGTTIPQYAKVSVLKDGDRGSLQVSYGIIQTNEGSNLRPLLENYCSKNGAYAKELEPYIPLIYGNGLYKDDEFRDLLRQAGQDYIMMRCQDELYYSKYILPATDWAERAGFTLPLSFLVILDSFVHSGGVHMFLRRRFVDKVPSEGGDEKRWVYNYILQRREWMQKHNNTLINNCVYRMDCFSTLILDDNWNLTKEPIYAHGIRVL